ncbi:MAG: prepilin-type N-terminal cleavage/methylation domain-containing protein [Acidobacteria bacterium]|nr:MAG: prepilin-type N-terminal cleavage/methylation domain-containing protein [Acidobacteriota bacterium]
MTMTNTTRTSSEKGFSLIEVMIAIVILTIGLLALAQMMVLSTNANTLSGRMTSCSGVAKERLERLKAVPFYSDPAARLRNPLLVAGGDVNVTVAGFSQFYDPDGLPVVGGNALFEVRWRIQDVVSPHPMEMLQIRMRCLPANGDLDQFAVIGDAVFTTFRTANIG